MYGRGRRGSGSRHTRSTLALARLLLLALYVRSAVGEGPGIVMFYTDEKFYETVKHYDLYAHSLEEISNPLTLRGCVYPCRCHPTLGAPWDKLSGTWYLVAENPKIQVTPLDATCQGVIVNSTFTTSFLETPEITLKHPGEIRHVNNTIWQIVKHPYSLRERHSGLFQYVTLVDDETLIIYHCGPSVQNQRMHHLQIFSSKKTQFPLSKAVFLSNKYSTNTVPYVRLYNNSGCKM